MTQVHLHLMVTHLPVFGSILGSLVLTYGIWSKSNQTKIAAYLLFILSGVGAGIAYFTGEGAEEAIENIQGISENVINQHEDSALYSLILLTILGALGVFAAIVTIKKVSLARSVALVTLLFSILSFGMVARTGYLGGQIRHTELASASMINIVEEKEND